MLLAPVVAFLPNQFKQDCMQLVKRAKVILISSSYIPLARSQIQREDLRCQLYIAVSWVSPYHGFHFVLEMCIGSCTMWIATRLGCVGQESYCSQNYRSGFYLSSYFGQESHCSQNYRSGFYLSSYFLSS